MLNFVSTKTVTSHFRKSRMINYVAEKWHEYATFALPLDCPESRKERAKQAFYAGAKAIIEIQKEFATLTDEEVYERMNLILGELLLFDARDEMKR